MEVQLKFRRKKVQLPAKPKLMQKAEAPKRDPYSQTPRQSASLMVLKDRIPSPNLPRLKGELPSQPCPTTTPESAGEFVQFTPDTASRP